MTGLVAVSLEGVLRAEVGQSVIPEGFNLYQALVTTYRVAVVLDDEDSELASLWLRKEGMRNFVLLHPRRRLDDRVGQYRRLMALGPVEMVIDASPVAVAGAMELGLPAMLFGHPRTHRPEWRPDYERAPRAWDTLVQQVESQRAVDATA